MVRFDMLNVYIKNGLLLFLLHSTRHQFLHGSAVCRCYI